MRKRVNVGKFKKKGNSIFFIFLMQLPLFDIKITYNVTAPWAESQARFNAINVMHQLGLILTIRLVVCTSFCLHYLRYVKPLSNARRSCSPLK